LQGSHEASDNHTLEQIAHWHPTPCQSHLLFL
jgi:hypothetical protein